VKNKFHGAICAEGMSKSVKNIMRDIFANWLNSDGKEFSGVLSVTEMNGVIFKKACGYRNRAEEIPNTVDTAFGIASGTKLFTGLAICKLIDLGRLSLECKLCDLLSVDLGQIDKRVTVFHLLTHTSGVGDYIDEDAEDCEKQLQALYDKYPVQLWTQLEYYLKMITPLVPKFEPGERYCYSNSGFVLLGLIVEAVSGMPYQQFVKENIIAPCKLTHTGFYRMDSLPFNTALGYMQDEDTEEWRTNIFSMPILGGSDGGLFTCAKDLDMLWRAVFSNKIISEKATQTFLKPYMKMGGEDEHSGWYGLGVYLQNNSSNAAYYAVGGDSGVDFFTAYFPQTKIVVSALGNINLNTFPLLKESFAVLTTS